MLTVLAPAKINLTLEVMDKRPDGYHEIRSVLQAINLCDTLHFQLAERIEFRSSRPEWSPEKSLVAKATRLLHETTECPLGALIEVEKRIPLMSGLGGDSSDAVAALLGLNQLWDLKLSPGSLLEIAWQLGSDVAFFLYGGTVLAKGRGEIITRLPSMPHMWVVLAMPPVPAEPGKTKRLYSMLRQSHFTGGEFTMKLAETLRSGGEFKPSLLFNTFENVTFTRFSRIKATRDRMVRMGANYVHLAGSGPTLFTLFKDKPRAEELCHLLEKTEAQSDFDRYRRFRRQSS